MKAGTTAAGSQRDRCTICGHKDTPLPKARGSPPELRHKVVQEYVDGRTLCQIAGQLGLVHQTVANWVAAHVDTLPEHPSYPQGVETAERDELSTFIGDKKRLLRRNQGGPGHALRDRVGRGLGAHGGGAPRGGRGGGPGPAVLLRCLRPYQTLVYYPGTHTVAPGKSQTYSVAADNAELRHYLARLGRRSRCFSRSIAALHRAVKLFVHAWSRRQLHKRAYPRYTCHVRDFVGPYS